MKNVGFILSILAIILSILAICFSLPRTELSFDYLGFITGILGVLVTVLIGSSMQLLIFDKRSNDLYNTLMNKRVTFIY